MKIDLSKTSEWGDFGFIPRTGWKIAHVFIDFQSKLLVVNEQPADQNKLRPNEFGTIHVPNQRYIVNVAQRRILPTDEWTQFFDYKATHKITPDGKYELIQQRIHNADTGLDFIEEKLIERESGVVISSGSRVAFYDKSYSNLYERHLENKERERKGEEIAAQKLSLEAHYFHYLKQLKDKDVLLRYQNAEGQIYRLVYVEGFFKFQREEVKTFAGSEQIHCFSFKRFETSEEAWHFMTQDPEWFVRYRPVWYKRDERISNPLFARHLIHVANEIRNTTQINWVHFRAISRWSNLLYAHDVDKAEFLQICPNCANRVSLYSRYPTYLCQDCRGLITDKHGRKLSFGNTSFSGGCQGYYAGTQEKYEGFDCYIDDKQFVAKEARFGGVVYELYDETRGIY